MLRKLYNRIREWLRCKYNQYQFWRHSYEIELLVSSFTDTKYPRTGIAQRPEDMVSFFQLHGIRPKKANRVIRICILHDIIRDQPHNKRGKRLPNQAQSKQFYYILNPDFLK